MKLSMEQRLEGSFLPYLLLLWSAPLPVRKKKKLPVCRHATRMHVKGNHSLASSVSNSRRRGWRDKQTAYSTNVCISSSGWPRCCMATMWGGKFALLHMSVTIFFFSHEARKGKTTFIHHVRYQGVDDSSFTRFSFCCCCCCYFPYLLMIKLISDSLIQQRNVWVNLFVTQVSG